MKKKKKNNNNHYVDKDMLSKLLGEYRITKVCSNELAKLFYTICENLCTRHQFRGYTFHDEFISYAVFRMFKYGKSFDPDKGNAFSYLTQIAWRSFLHVIRTEKDQHSLSEKLVDEMDDQIDPTSEYNDDEFEYWENRFNHEEKVKKEAKKRKVEDELN